jgi:hypothetical protein
MLSAKQVACMKHNQSSLYSVQSFAWCSPLRKCGFKLCFCSKILRFWKIRPKFETTKNQKRKAIKGSRRHSLCNVQYNYIPVSTPSADTQTPRIPALSVGSAFDNGTTSRVLGVLFVRYVLLLFSKTYSLVVDWASVSPKRTDWPDRT